MDRIETRPRHLTKVRTQDTPGIAVWLWVLTFVRMTGGVTG
jgi:hypothetical protein